MCVESKMIDYLLENIKNETYKEGDKLPSENTLADVFRVPRVTVRKVYEKLEQMGYTYSLQGKGRYIRPRQTPIELVLTGKESFTQKMRAKGYELISQNLGCERIVYDSKIYEALEVEQGANVYRIRRKRILQEKPVAIHISYLAEEMFSEIAEEGKEILSIFEYYRQKGIVSFEEEPSMLSLSYGSEQEREWLACIALMPLITVEGRCRDSTTGKVLEYTQIKYRSDCFTYKIGV